MKSPIVVRSSLFDLLHKWFSNRFSPCWTWSYRSCRILLKKHCFLLDSVCVLFWDGRIPQLCVHALLRSNCTCVPRSENWVKMLDAEIFLVSRRSAVLLVSKKNANGWSVIFYLLFISLFTLFICFMARDTSNQKKCANYAILRYTGIRGQSLWYSY